MTAPALFSLVPLSTTEQDLPEPENGPYYVATQKGYYVMQRTHWGRVLVPVKEIPTIPEQTHSWIWHNEPQLPPEIVSSAWSFFRTVYVLQKTEAMVDITWHPKHGYRLFVPPQDVHHGGVKAKRNPEHYQPGSRLVGTIHSHCNFAAYHSGTDTHDADGHDGLHMTIGHVLDDKLDIAVMISSNGIRWEQVDLDRVVIKPDQIHVGEFPTWWLKFPLEPSKEPPKPVPPTTAPRPATNNNGQQIIRWIPPCTHGKRLEETCAPCGRYPEDRKEIVAETTKHTDLDSLAEDLHFTDPRIDVLAEVAWKLDDITRELEELGIDFDYEVDQAVPFTTPNRFPAETNEEDDQRHWRGGHMRW